MQVTEKLARDIAHAFQVGRFERSGYDPKAIAQRALQGRTHYVDDDTLRFFHSRINSVRIECEGLLFLLVESVASDFRNTSRGFRFVAFDVTGTVVNDRYNSDTLLNTSAKAWKACEEWLAGFDPVEHYRGAIRDAVSALERQAESLKGALAKLESGK